MLISKLKWGFLALLFSNFALANASPLIATVPFESVILNPGNGVQASYAFNNHPIIFCFDNNFKTIGYIAWPFNGLLRSSTLPISLKTQDVFEGEFADISGMITIVNTTTTQIVVSCQYGF